MKLNLSEEEELKLKKKNRIQKLAPKTHKVSHESGRSTKTLWAQIITRAKNKNG